MIEPIEKIAKKSKIFNNFAFFLKKGIEIMK